MIEELNYIEIEKTSDNNQISDFCGIKTKNDYTPSNHNTTSIVKKRQIAEEKKHNPKFDVPKRLNSFEYDAERKPIIKKIIYQNQITLLQGRSKSGKSLLATQMAIDMTTGAPFVGNETIRVGNVLYINLEIDNRDFRSRLIDICKNNNISLSAIQGFFYLGLRGTEATIDEIISEIEFQISELNIDYVIIDCLYVLLADVDENSNSAVTTVLKKIQHITEATNSGVLLLHHISDKADSSNLSGTAKGSGASAIARFADTIINLEEIDLSEIPEHLHKNEKAVRLSYVFRGSGEVSPTNLWFDYPNYILDLTGMLEYCLLKSGNKKANQERREKLEAAIEKYEESLKINSYNEENYYKESKYL